jgi:hypothetical protein
MNQFATTVVAELVVAKVEFRYSRLGFENADYTICA